MEIIKKIAYYIQFPFVIRAFVVAILISASCSMLGVSLVFKRFSYIGNSLSNVAFSAMAVATALKFTGNTLLVFAITFLTSLAILKLPKKENARGDAIIGLVSVGALAVGYLVINVFGTGGNISSDVCTTLFGSTSILTISKLDVAICTVISLVVIIFYILYHNKIFALTFDEDFLKASGIGIEKYNILFAVFISAIIVVGINLVGSLLLSSLVIFPSLSAMRIMKTFKKIVICSVIISILCTFIGLIISILCGTPIGSTIVIVNIICLLFLYILGKLR